MLLVAAILTVAVGLMHSIVGGKRLIEPILQLKGLPVILGSEANTRQTLRFGWHFLTLTWWGVAGVFAYLHFTRTNADVAFLLMVAILFALSGFAALVVSRGKHLSWIFFLPTAAIAGYAAFTG